MIKCHFKTSSSKNVYYFCYSGPNPTHQKLKNLNQTQPNPWVSQPCTTLGSHTATGVEIRGHSQLLLTSSLGLT